MFWHDQVTVTLLEFLLVLLLALAAMAAPIALKIVCYRRRVAKGERGLLAREADRAINVGDKQEGVTDSLEDAVIELIRLLRGCPYTLRVLAAQNKPVSFKTVLQKVWQEQQSHNESGLVPASAIRSVLRLLQGSGFVRLDRHGFVVTDLGRKLYERIERVSRARLSSTKCVFSSCVMRCDERRLTGPRTETERCERTLRSAAGGGHKFPTATLSPNHQQLTRKNKETQI
jgi:hypothetical protein